MWYAGRQSFSFRPPFFYNVEKLCQQIVCHNRSKVIWGIERERDFLQRPRRWFDPVVVTSVCVQRVSAAAAAAATAEPPALPVFSPSSPLACRRTQWPQHHAGAPRVHISTSARQHVSNPSKGWKRKATVSKETAPLRCAMKRFRTDRRHPFRRFCRHRRCSGVHPCLVLDSKAKSSAAGDVRGYPMLAMTRHHEHTAISALPRDVTGDVRQCPYEGRQ